MRSVGLRAGPVLRQQDSPCHARRGDPSRKAPDCEPAGRRRSRRRLASAVWSDAILVQRIDRSGWFISSDLARPRMRWSDRNHFVDSVGRGRARAGAPPLAVLGLVAAGGRDERGDSSIFNPSPDSPDPAKRRPLSRGRTRPRSQQKSGPRPKKVRQGRPASIGEEQANASSHRVLLTRVHSCC